MRWQASRQFLPVVVIALAAISLLLLRLSQPLVLISDGGLEEDPLTGTALPAEKLLVSRRPPGNHLVAIIGAGGYIGSSLQEVFLSTADVQSIGFDRLNRNYPNSLQPLYHMSSSEIPTSDLRQFDVVIYLGGLSGRVECNKRPQIVTAENVDDIVHLARRMDSRQTLIFASTSAVMEGHGDAPQYEDGVVQLALLDLYSQSLHSRETHLQLLSNSGAGPRMVGLRFGTVIGLSPSQRTDMLHLAIVRSALLGGTVSVSSVETYRAILAMEDLKRAMLALVRGRNRLRDRYSLYHLRSFGTSVGGAAGHVAYQCNARIFSKGNSSSPGFDLDASRFSRDFDFEFQVTQAELVRSLQQGIEQLSLGRDLIDRPLAPSDEQPMPCVVCGSRDLQLVLDLQRQPLANSFSASASEAQRARRYPLKLMRCRRCQHAQLSHLVDRKLLFDNYLYQSGTSRALSDYFDWLSARITADAGQRPGAALDIASNDGSMLDKLQQYGWKTYGVDPAANLAKLARAKGHVVDVAFWGEESNSSSRRLFDGKVLTFDAIVAMNVLAHVPSPLAFLRACVPFMTLNSRLYIQTSQCEMFATAQFDTVYHEHVSFFSALSFKHVAEAAGLYVADFRITPIHGNSCLLTFMKQHTLEARAHAAVFQEAVAAEVAAGMRHEHFYVRYRARAEAMARWMHQELNALAASGFEVAGYGAAAKGMVLMHMLRSIPGRAYEFSFLIDDAPLKQGTYCPGTDIPVRPTSALGQRALEARPLVLVIFAWNFWEEISGRLVAAMASAATNSAIRVLAMLPFPEQKLQLLPIGAGLAAGAKPLTLVVNPFRQPLWTPGNVSLLAALPSPTATTPSPPASVPSRAAQRPRTVLITHFYNEELLLPFFIRHHAHMFDQAVLIDYQSTDRSVKIIREQAPPTWTVVTSRYQDFSAFTNDEEVMEVESRYPDSWKIALTITEFLVHPDLTGFVAEAEHISLPGFPCIRFPVYYMTGNDSKPLMHEDSLLRQRSLHQKYADVSWYSRFFHRLPRANYTPGRHGLSNPPGRVPISDTGYLVKFIWTPWPDIIERKMQINDKRSESDKKGNWGGQHAMNYTEQNAKRDRELQQPLNDWSELVTSYGKSEPSTLTEQVWLWHQAMWYSETGGEFKYV